MKKLSAFFAAFLAAAALTFCVAATSRGAIYIEDNGYFDEKVTTAAPGDTVYIALAEKSEDGKTTISAKMVPSTVKITSVKVKSFEDDKTYSGILSTGSLDIVTKDTDDDMVWYFAELKIGDISMSKYPEDGFYVEGKVKVTRKGGTSFTVDLADVLTSIQFTEATDDSELKKTAQFYRLDGSEDYSMEFPNGKGRFEFHTKRDIEVTAGMSHTKITAITKKNKDADMVFYIGNGAKFEYLRDPKLIFEADDDCYLYKIGSNNKLTDMTDCYDDDEDGFVVETDTLGSYVVSDEEISGASTGSGSGSTETEYVYNEQESSGSSYGYLTNPNTGAVL